MSTLWTLREKGVRWTYSPHVRTFFWVEENFFENNHKELEEFCVDTGSDFQYAKSGWMQCADDLAVTLFMLRWS